MAEEEVLQEAAPPPSKKKSGGFNIMYLVILLVVIIGAAIMTFVLVSGKISSANEKMEQAIADSAKSSIYRTEGRIPIDECMEDEKSQNAIVQLTAETPMIVMLADGQSYLSVDVALCVRDYQTKPGPFDSKKPLIMHLINDYLSTYPKSYFFDQGVGDVVTSGVSESELEAADLLGDAGTEQAHKKFLKMKNEIRSELVMELKQNGAPFVEEVYFPSFLIQ